MNKTAIKNFAAWARNKLISDITYKASLLGVTGRGIKAPLPQSTKDAQFFDIGMREPFVISGKEIEQRRKLAEKITEEAKRSDYAAAYKAVIEEVACTWFSRLIAVRFMEVNDYLPAHVRVLSSESGKAEPDIVTAPFETLAFTQAEREVISRLKNNKPDELFRVLFIKQCNALNAILPELFEKTNDYTEILLNISYTDKEGIVWHLVNDITEDAFKDAVQIIGWLYQYYNEQRRNEVINIYKGTVKKEDIPAATQLFTPEWVVRYMVDNSLGRYWLERNPQSGLREKLAFFVALAGDITVDEKLDPRDLTVFDPCVGSGHILVYAFDVLMDIYRECGYTDRDAAVSILRNNIYGLDIDDRVTRLAYFALMMKARSYNRRVLTMGLSPNILAIQESNSILRFTEEGVTDDKEQNAIGEYLVEVYRHAKEIGSIQEIEPNNYSEFESYLESCGRLGQADLQHSAWMEHTRPLMRKLAAQAKIMSEKYAVVVTNPPYLNKMEGHLKEFIISKYKPYGGDLFSVFIYRNFGFCKADGYSAFMSPLVWMFIKAYENLREFIINNKSITTLVQMEYSAFEEATVPICAFVLKNAKEQKPGVYFKPEFKGGMDVQCRKVLEAIANPRCGYRYTASAGNFMKIPGMPLAYWLSENFISAFERGKPLGDYAEPRLGMATADNNTFTRFWFEIARENMAVGCADRDEARKSGRRWFPYNKGGDYRKWYGNNDVLVNWENDGAAIQSFKDEKTGRTRSHNYNLDYIFREGLTWTFVSSSKFGIRYSPKGFLFDVGGSTMFMRHDRIYYTLAYLSSKLAFETLKAFNPTMNFQAGNLCSLPVIFDESHESRIVEITLQNIEASRRDWDSFETSWDFMRHPLLTHKTTDRLTEAYDNYKAFTQSEFARLKANEEELNRIFIEIYGLSAELTPEVEGRDITITYVVDEKTAEDKKNAYCRDRAEVIRSLISYAVGCMFGRYSLASAGIAYAGGEWDSGRYNSFIPDKDNIIPITDGEYLQNNIAGRFAEFIRVAFGADTLSENLDFIAKALGNKGSTSREVIRNYFLNDFYKDHVKTYRKRPIYWLFDSGRQNGFKALIYLHRYNEDTIGNLRIEYLHRIQRIYDSEIARMKILAENSADAREGTAAEKRREKLVKQLKEAKEYDEKISRLSLRRIALDLDDGVKANYEKIQHGDGKTLDVLAGI